MFSILMSAIWSLVGWVFRAGVAKLLTFVALFEVVSLAMSYVTSVNGMQAPTVLSSALSAIPSGVWYFLDYLGFSSFFPMLLAAVVTRFLIRRIPFFG